jgi:transposase
MLFEEESRESFAPDTGCQTGSDTPRLRIPHRDQIEMRCAALDDLLDPDHRARIVWQAIQGWDVSRWLTDIKAVEGNVGRHATDPRLLVALWVYATLDGVGSARELARLCEKHLAYQWLCGGVTVNHHLLSDFRSQNGEAWDALLTHMVASLLAEGLVTMHRVAQDGMRVRASAGSASFRRRGRLESFLEQAQEQVETLRRLADHDPEELTQRQRAARQRAARERQERIEQAQQHCMELQQQRDAQAKISGQPAKAARTSTTDPEARIMQFPDGGYRPGYNVQFSTDTASGVIVGLDAVNAGSDSRQLPPMLEQFQQRYGRTPAEALIDGGFATRETIEIATARNCVVYGPIKDEKAQLARGQDPYAPKRRDSAAIAAWRARMGEVAAKAIYRLRAPTAEWVNALARNRGLRFMPLRGQAKCRAVVTLYAIAHNLMQATMLRAKASS